MNKYFCANKKNTHCIIYVYLRKSVFLKITRTKTSIRYTKENDREKRERRKERERKVKKRRDIEREGEIRERGRYKRERER